MSSTGRSPRLGGADDVYNTPAWCVDRLMEAWQPLPGILMEPCVGSGAIVRAVNAHAADRDWVLCDVRDVHPQLADLVDLGSRLVRRDFIQTQDIGGAEVSAVITNPPYSWAEGFIRHSRTLCPNADIVMLLRLAFTASEDRIPLWPQMGAPDLYVLPNRPSFRKNGKGKNGSDSADYAWFVFPPRPRPSGNVTILNSTPLQVRKGENYD